MRERRAKPRRSQLPALRQRGPRTVSVPWPPGRGSGWAHDATGELLSTHDSWARGPRPSHYGLRRRRATPEAMAASATASATAGTTRGSNIVGVMYSSLSSLLLTIAASAWAAASFI